MKLQELLSPYRELAEMRRERQKDSAFSRAYPNDFNKTNELGHAFEWGKTPEGFVLWNEIDDCQYPEIPASSLQELAEWQKSKLPEANPHHCPECNWQCSCSDNPCSCCHETTEITSPTLIGGKTDTEWIYLFAGQAMQGLLSNTEWMDEFKGIKLIMSDEAVSKTSVEKAKALLTQLKKEVENV